MNDQAKDELVEDLMQHIRSTITACVRQAVREYSSRQTPKECTVTLWASETAAYIGRDSWTSRDKALASVWRRTNEAQFNAVQDIWRAHGGCLPDGDATKEHVRKRLALSFDPFPDVVTPEDVEAFRKIASTSDVLKLYKAKGQMFEETLAEEFSKSVLQTVQMRHASVVWSSVTQTAVPRPAGNSTRPEHESITDPGPFQIVGQVDGWLCQPPYENTIVEFKLRCTRIPNDIPYRDFAQVQTYLHVHDTREAMYVQGLLGSRELRVATIPRNEEVWRDVIFPGLQTFVCDVRRLLRGASADVPLQSRVLCAYNDDAQQAAPLVKSPAVSRSSSVGPVHRRKVAAPLAPHPQRASTPPAQAKAPSPNKAPEALPVAYLPAEYKPPVGKAKTTRKKAPARADPSPEESGYNTRSKKRQKQSLR